LKGPKESGGHASGPDSRLQDCKGWRSEYFLPALFIVLAVKTGVVGHPTFRGQSQNYLIDVEQRWSSISELEALEPIPWRRELNHRV
jgi:hypothetical protein